VLHRRPNARAMTGDQGGNLARVPFFVSGHLSGGSLASITGGCQIGKRPRTTDGGQFTICLAISSIRRDRTKRFPIRAIGIRFVRRFAAARHFIPLSAQPPPPPGAGGPQVFGPFGQGMRTHAATAMARHRTAARRTMDSFISTIPCHPRRDHRTAD
jgi:hypothetical protein